MFLLVALMMVSSIQPLFAMEAAAADEGPAGNVSPRPDSVPNQVPVVAPLASPRSKPNNELFLSDQADLNAGAAQVSNNRRRGSVIDVSVLDVQEEQDEGQSIAAFCKGPHVAPHIRQFFGKHEALVAQHAELQESFLVANNMVQSQTSELSKEAQIKDALLARLAGYQKEEVTLKNANQSLEERCAQLVKDCAVLQGKCAQLEALRAGRQASVGSSEFEIDVIAQDGTRAYKKMEKRRTSSRRKSGDAGVAEGQEAVERKDGASHNGAGKSFDVSESINEADNKKPGTWWSAVCEAWATPIIGQ